MRKISKRFATVMIVAACVFFVHGTKFVIESFGRNARKVDGKIKGDDKAPIKVVEFIDFQCPGCALGFEYLNKKMKEHPGMIRVEVKHYPLQMHRHGFLSSQYGECAARQDKFWPFLEKLLAEQNQWSDLYIVHAAFENIAREARINLKDLQACLEDKTIDDVIHENKAEGKKLGVKSTPTYFVNGEMVVGKKSLEGKITQLLKDHGH